jgi:hypothetical protein
MDLKVIILVGIGGFVALTCLGVSWARQRGDKLFGDEDADCKPKPPTDIECINCQAIIPVGQTKCSKCGWTYENENPVS